MADRLDIANDLAECERDHMISEARKNADIKPGTPGDCDLCGEWSGRLIASACAPCRDKYQLK